MNLKKLGRVLALALTVSLLCLSLTGCATAGTAADGTTTSAGGGYSMIIMFVVLIAVFYFFLIRPENKKKKQLQEMRDGLSVGDSVTTIGGIMGKIVSIKDDTITFETSEDRVRIQVTKWAISSVGKQTEENAK